MKARNTEVGKTGSGKLAPRPKNNWPASQTKFSHPVNGALARIKEGGAGDSGQRLPDQSPSANIAGNSQPYGGNGTPPAPRAGGRNQGWPNGALYTDSVKKGGTAHSTPTLSRSNQSSRRKKGAAFYGEF